MKQIVLCLIGILFASFVSAQKINHPSLLYTPQRIQQVKQRMQNEPKLREAWEDIQKTADEALQKKDFNRLDYLSLAYLMTDNKEYANIIKEILLKAVEAESWGDMEMMARIPAWRSQLGMAHKSFLSAIGYDAAYNIMSSSERKKIAEIKDSIKDAGDLVRFMYDHCVACAEEYTDWTARRAVKEIAKEMLGLKLE